MTSLVQKLQLNAGQSLKLVNPLRQIALDDVWSVLRFRLAERVGK